MKRKIPEIITIEEKIENFIQKDLTLINTIENFENKFPLSTFKNNKNEENSLKRNKLRKISSNYNLEQKKYKNELINTIYNFSLESNRNHDKSKYLLNLLNSDSLLDKSYLHHFYKKNFNTIDLFDSLFYKVEYNHHFMNWRFKLIKSILKIVVINSWIYYYDKKPLDLLLFREELAKELLFNDKK